ncbi:MAG: alpha/beta hydrolase [Clostridia bacterium]|nr:alpha/beta hydrolase [Clostridia bacterium]
MLPAPSIVIIMKRMKWLKKVLKVLAAVLGFAALCIAALAVYNRIALKKEASRIVPNGEMIDLGEYSVHVYAEGAETDSPVLVFLSGSATVAPVYDFKALYNRLTDEYRIAVVEKAGYGYSDIVRVERDVKTMVEEVRGAVFGAGIRGPFVLVPHSMSGLEAIYWAQNYPSEVAGIVGIDMSVPDSYDDFDFGRINTMRTIGKLSVLLGLMRIPGLYPLNDEPLSEYEKEQQKLLMYRNAVNIDYIEEGKRVYENAQTVKSAGNITCPVLMFCSNGKEIGDFWLPAQNGFAQENNAEIVTFDCGHYIHYYKSYEMAEHIKRFMERFK